MLNQIHNSSWSLFCSPQPISMGQCNWSYIFLALTRCFDHIIMPYNNLYRWCSNINFGHGQSVIWCDWLNIYQMALLFSLLSNINGLVQEKCNSSVLVKELHLSCTNPSNYYANLKLLFILYELLMNWYHIWWYIWWICIWAHVRICTIYIWGFSAI